MTFCVYAKAAIPLACLLGLAALLIAAAVRDVQVRRIPNGICLAIALLSLPYWLSVDVTPVVRLATQLALSACGLAVMALLFVRRYLGGGDVKLIAAVLLWLPPQAAVTTILAIAIIGGPVAIFTLLHARWSRRVGAVKVPYGVAIALGCMMPVALRIITLFMNIR